MNRDTIRPIVRGAYDIQKLRIQTGNRIVGNFRAKLGIAPGEKEEDAAEAKRVLDNLRARFRLLTEGVVRFPNRARFKGDEIISSYSEFCLLAQYFDLEGHEKQHFRRLGALLEDVPVFAEFLADVRGVGPAMAGVIISEFDITQARYASSLWAYAGLDVAKDGRGRSRRKEHLIKREYADADGNDAERDSITFNPFLKTKLIGVLGPSFLRAGGQYAEIYRGYKHRLENMPAHVEKSKGHRHNMAIRYMVKIFLVDLYTAWRTIEGLPVEPSYAEGKLGKKHAA
jgi:hypothetical protein